MKNKNISKNNIKRTIGFNDNKIFNLVLSVGFLNLIFIFFNGLPSIKTLSFFEFFLFTSSLFCSFFFIFFLIKILLFDILLNDYIDNSK